MEIRVSYIAFFGNLLMRAKGLMTALLLIVEGSGQAFVTSFSRAYFLRFQINTSAYSLGKYEPQ